jgi:hypothetical protein
LDDPSLAGRGELSEGGAVSVDRAVSVADNVVKVSVQRRELRVVESVERLEAQLKAH